MEGERVRKRGRGREKERGREGESEKEGEKERDVEYGCFIFILGMTDGLAPFSYLVIK
jgi:hypothetical protein